MLTLALHHKTFGPWSQARGTRPLDPTTSNLGPWPSILDPRPLDLGLRPNASPTRTKMGIFPTPRHSWP
eukprot:1136165-Rhodomonas_salina.3